VREVDKRADWVENRFVTQTGFLEIPMTAQELDRIQFVTRHFRALQGLRVVPIAVFMIVVALLPPTPWGVLAMLVVALTLIAPMGWPPLRRWMSSYYADRFGAVEPMPVNPVGPRAQRVIAIGALLAFVGAMFLLFGGNKLLHLPEVSRLPSPYLILGGVFLCIWLLRGARPIQVHYLLVGSLLIWLGAAGRGSDRMLARLPGVAPQDLAMGAALTIVGLLDHLLLVRTMRLATAEDLAAAETVP
jgi:hypothetical protein